MPDPALFPFRGQGRGFRHLDTWTVPFMLGCSAQL